MAKNVGRLAGLAALAGAAYMMSKGKDKDKGKVSEDAGDQKTSSYTGDTKKVEAAGIDEAEMKRETQRGPIGQFPSKAKTMSVSKPSIKGGDLPKADSPKADLRDAEAGKSRGSRASSSTTSSSEEGMKNYVSRAGSLAGAGRGSVNPPSVTPQQPARDAEAGTSRGTRTTSTAGAGRGSVNPPVVKPSGPRDSEAGMSRGTRPAVVGSGRGTVNPASVTPQQSSRDVEAGMSRGRREMAPSPGQAQVDTVRKLQSAARVPSSRAGMPGYDESGRPMMAGRRGYDEAGNPMKKGGAVKKMASGGMTASRRADGIASRGKTKCKMY